MLPRKIKRLSIIAISIAAIVSGCAQAPDDGKLELTAFVGAPIPEEEAVTPKPEAPIETGSVEKPNSAPVPPAAPRKVLPLKQLSLADAVGLALAMHPDIGRAEADVSKSAAEVSIAQAAWYPKIGYSSNLGGSSSTSSSSANASSSSVGVQVEQLIYDFGRADSQIAATEATNRQRSAELTDVMQRVALTASEAYVEQVRSKKLAEATDRFLTSLANLRETIQLRSTSGAAGEGDLHFADVRIQGAEGDKIRATTRHKSAEARLARIIGVQPHSLVDPIKTMIALSAKVANQRDEGATGVEAAENAAQAAHARVTLTEASLYPSINFKANHDEGLAIGGGEADSTSTFGLSIQGDLFNGGANYARIEAAQKEAISADRAVEVARLNAGTEVDLANAEISGAKLRKTVFANQAEMARRARDVYLAEYGLNKRTLIEVLNAEQEIYRADTEQINAAGDAFSAVVRSAAAKGVLLGSLSNLAAGS